MKGKRPDRRCSRCSQFDWLEKPDYWGWCELRDGRDALRFWVSRRKGRKMRNNQSRIANQPRSIRCGSISIAVLMLPFALNGHAKGLVMAVIVRGGGGAAGAVVARSRRPSPAGPRGVEPEHRNRAAWRLGKAAPVGIFSGPRREWHGTTQRPHRGLAEAPT